MPSKLMSNKLLLSALLAITPASAQAEGFFAFASADFSCAYVSRAFNDEQSIRATLKPTPPANSFVTIDTTKISYYIAGVLSGMNAAGSNIKAAPSPEPFNVYKPGLLPAVMGVRAYCDQHLDQSLYDGLWKVLENAPRSP